MVVFVKQPWRQKIFCLYTSWCIILDPFIILFFNAKDPTCRRIPVGSGNMCRGRKISDSTRRGVFLYVLFFSSGQFLQPSVNK